MPTYTYQCNSCQHIFDALHKMSETPPKCESCGAKVKKLIVAPQLNIGHDLLPGGTVVKNDFLDYHI